MHGGRDAEFQSRLRVMDIDEARAQRKKTKLYRLGFKSGYPTKQLSRVSHETAIATDLVANTCEI